MAAWFCSAPRSLPTRAAASPVSMKKRYPTSMSRICRRPAWLSAWLNIADKRVTLDANSSRSLAILSSTEARSSCCVERLFISCCARRRLSPILSACWALGSNSSTKRMRVRSILPRRMKPRVPLKIKSNAMTPKAAESLALSFICIVFTPILSSLMERFGNVPPWGRRLVKIEQFSEERFLFMVAMPALSVVMSGCVHGLASLIIVGPGAGVLGRGQAGAFDNLVQLASVEPDAATLRTVVDLDAASLRHMEGDGAFGTLHGGSPQWVLFLGKRSGALALRSVSWT
ncbi:hypothetical protein DVDV_0811 [Desulfovibrio sp. DV]|nr:hypothetical protein DVDV_0811 [Desulfovibrio sp. DV]